MALSGPSINDDNIQQFLLLLGRHERWLQAFVLSLVPNWADADDIVQEVRICLWQQFDSYDPTKDFGAGPCDCQVPGPHLSQAAVAPRETAECRTSGDDCRRDRLDCRGVDR